MIFIFTLTALLLVGPLAFAQNSSGADARREELQQNLREVQSEIERYKTEIEGKQKEAKTLAREVSILEREIKKTELEIAKTSLALRATALEIESNSRKIVEFQEKIEREKEILAEILRSLYAEDTRSMVELIVSSGDVSDFFEHQQFLESLEVSLSETLSQVKSAKINIEQDQEVLAEEYDAQDQLKALQEVQKKSFKEKNGQKRKLLGLTKKEKQAFEDLIKNKERDIAEIRQRLFLLEGAGVSLTLEKAYEIANFASQKSGVRPAFLLALLKQESSWGQNVGQCYLVDPKTGAGKGKNTGNVYLKTMKAARDIEPFLNITQEFGRDPYATLVSCPHPDYGYGGAIGPAQFLPSTWLAYRTSAAQLLGHAPDPWDLEDSFTVAALKLANAGATSQTHEGEWKAAMIYYAGKNWNNPAYSFYGDSVMELARAIQEEIDAIK